MQINMHTHTRHMHISCFYMTLNNKYDRICKKICKICTYSIFCLNYEKNAKNVNLTPGLPVAGRPGVEVVKNMQNITNM